MPESSSPPRGIQIENVSAFFRDRVPGGDAELRFSLIGDGRSNITYRVDGGDRTWVLRRPPLGYVLPTAHDMAREFRVLDGLADTAVPVPRPIALCEDEAVNERPFYVMEYRPGAVLDGTGSWDVVATPEKRRRMSEALVDGLVALHAVDYEAVGLGNFGRPEGYLERQVRRWLQQWERSTTGPLPVIEELIRRLQAALPESPNPTIVHGDYRLGNLALDPADPGRIVAIFDWEMATLGDPLADLGYTLGYWYDPRAQGPLSTYVPPDPSGLLSPDELVERYAKQSGRDVSSIDFYRVLALYKLAVISEGIYARFQKGQTLGEQFRDTHRMTGPIAERALAIANASPDPHLRG
jgi:aminoglycoside phosphotransferase (APT) family kinase protein